MLRQLQACPLHHDVNLEDPLTASNGTQKKQKAIGYMQGRESPASRKVFIAVTAVDSAARVST